MSGCVILFMVINIVSSVAAKNNALFFLMAENFMALNLFKDEQQAFEEGVFVSNTKGIVKQYDNTVVVEITGILSNKLETNIKKIAIEIYFFATRLDVQYKNAVYSITRNIDGSIPSKTSMRFKVEVPYVNRDIFILEVKSYILISDNVDAVLRYYRSKDDSLTKIAAAYAFSHMTANAVPGLINALKGDIPSGNVYEKMLEDLLILEALATIRDVRTLLPLLQLMKKYQKKKYVDKFEILKRANRNKETIITYFNQAIRQNKSLTDIISEVIKKLGSRVAPKLVAASYSPDKELKLYAKKMLIHFNKVSVHQQLARTIKADQQEIVQHIVTNGPEEDFIEVLRYLRSSSEQDKLNITESIIKIAEVAVLKLISSFKYYDLRPYKINIDLLERIGEQARLPLIKRLSMLGYSDIPIGYHSIRELGEKLAAVYAAKRIQEIIKIIQLAKRAKLQGRIEEAIAYLDQIFQLEPNYSQEKEFIVQTYVEYAETHTGSELDFKYRESAFKYLKKAEKLAPENEQVKKALGKYYFHCGMKEKYLGKALKFFEKADSYYPDTEIRQKIIEIHGKLGDIDFKEHDWHFAIKHYRMVLDEEPENNGIKNKLGRVIYRKNLLFVVLALIAISLTGFMTYPKNSFEKKS